MGLLREKMYEVGEIDFFWGIIELQWWYRAEDGMDIRKTKEMDMDIDKELHEFFGVELMQFTGLYDKHQKPIYEGDIVSYFGLKYEVLFKNGAFGWMEDGAFYSFNEMDRSEVNKFEIIGNIYENPELLEESK